MQRHDNEELLLEFKKQEQDQVRHLSSLDAKIASRQEELAGLTLRNTQLLEDLRQLIHEQRNLSRAMKSAKAELFSDPVLKQQQELAERDRMIRVVQDQAQVIEELRDELTRLRAKSGSVRV